MRKGTCIHCNKNDVNVTDDHVFPKSWYPESTPKDLQKWTAPSCLECNQEHGRNEEDLLIRLGLCIDPNEAKSSGITEKVLRSLKPEFARNEKDRRVRALKRQRIIEESKALPAPPTKGVLPNFGLQPNIVYKEYRTITINGKKLEKLARKIVRGTTYVLERRIIENSDDIGVYFTSEHNVADIIALIKSHGDTYVRGPGFEINRAVTQDGTDAALFRITIWGKLRLYASVIPSEKFSE